MEGRQHPLQGEGVYPLGQAARRHLLQRRTEQGVHRLLVDVGQRRQGGDALTVLLQGVAQPLEHHGLQDEIHHPEAHRLLQGSSFPRRGEQDHIQTRPRLAQLSQ